MSKRYCDLVYKLILAIGFEYLLFFGLEAILPGIIVDVFDINILLITTIVLLAMLSGVKKCNRVLFTESQQGKLLKISILTMVLFLFMVATLVLHKLNLFWIGAYLVIGLFTAKLLWDNI